MSSKEEKPVDGAIVRAVDLPKVMRLEKYGFKLKAKPTADGRIYVEVYGRRTSNS